MTGENRIPTGENKMSFDGLARGSALTCEPMGFVFQDQKTEDSEGNPSGTPRNKDASIIIAVTGIAINFCQFFWGKTKKIGCGRGRCRSIGRRVFPIKKKKLSKTLNFTICSEKSIVNPRWVKAGNGDLKATFAIFPETMFIR